MKSDEQRSSISSADSAGPVSILVIGSRESDASALESIIRAAGWALHRARSWKDAVRCLKHHFFQVVITERDAPGCDWKQVLLELSRLPAPPLLIVTSRLADDYLWSEVLNLGGYDVLLQPFEREEVLRVVGAARRRFDSDGRRNMPADNPAVSSLRIA